MKMIIQDNQIKLYGFILILPFIMFYWMLPFVSNRTIGNDYQRYAMEEQIELMFSLETGSFPLYSPGFAKGQSAGALTQGQIFHPISHIAASMPGYWNGNQLEWTTLLRLISLGAVQLLLFVFLSRIQLGSTAAFLFSFITVYNLRMLDLFRYGASLESWTGYVFLCSVIGLYFLKPTKVKGPLLIIAATYWLVCSGHPQMMYYALIGTGLFILVIPWFLAAVMPEKNMDIRTAAHFWLRAGICLITGIALSSAYIFPFYFDFLSNNGGRVALGTDYQWSLLYQDTVMGTINNFFSPLRTDVCGVFGGSSLYLAGILIPLLTAFRMRIPAVIWGILLILLITFLYIQGSRTLIHYIGWKYLPFMASLRGPGRISLIMPVFIMLILIWLIKMKPLQIKFTHREVQIYPYALLAAMGIFLIIVYMHTVQWLSPVPQYSFADPAAVPETDSATYSALSIRNIPLWFEYLLLFSGIISLLLFAFQHETDDRKIEKTAGKKIMISLFLCMVAVFQTGGFLYYGTWEEEKKRQPSFQYLMERKQKEIDYYHGIAGFGMYSDTVFRQAVKSFYEPFLAKTYRKYLIARDNEHAYDLMNQERKADEAVIENFVSKQEDENKGDNFISDEITLHYSSYNRIVFDINAAASCFLVLNYPYTGNWKAFVNGSEVPVYCANGAYHAVYLSSGVSQVEFRYQSSAALCGTAISCLTFVLIGLTVCFYFPKPVGSLIALATLAVSFSGFYIWYNSLYNGDNLGTSYHWTTDLQPSADNLAYGRRTKMSSLFYIIYPYIYNSGGGIDGDRTAKSMFITGKQPNPWWLVDLYHPAEVSLVKLYENMSGDQFNKRPLFLSFSSDGKNWIWDHTEISSYDNPVTVKLDNPVKARYILLSSHGHCRLSFNEIEVYSHDNPDSSPK